MKRFLHRITNWLVARAQRTPYEHITDYMQRWWLWGGSGRDKRSVVERGWQGSRLDSWLGRWICCARVHHTQRSDNDRHMHDHPAWSISIVLRGGYGEVMPRHQHQHAAYDRAHFTTQWRGPGSIVLRHATTRHRLVVMPGCKPISLFILGRKTQKWGFYTPLGKIYHDAYDERAFYGRNRSRQLDGEAAA